MPSAALVKPTTCTTKIARPMLLDSNGTESRRHNKTSRALFVATDNERLATDTPLNYQRSMERPREQHKRWRINSGLSEAVASDPGQRPELQLFHRRIVLVFVNRIERIPFSMVGSFSVPSVGSCSKSRSLSVAVSESAGFRLWCLKILWILVVGGWCIFPRSVDTPAHRP